MLATTQIVFRTLSAKIPVVIAAEFPWVVVEVVFPQAWYPVAFPGADPVVFLLVPVPQAFPAVTGVVFLPVFCDYWFQLVT